MASAQLPLLAALAKKREKSLAKAAPAAAADDAAKAAQGDSERRQGTGYAGAIDASREKQIRKKKKTVKAKKGAPMEVSNHKPVAPPVKTKRKMMAEPRDPRFDDFSGKLNVDMFAKSYAFLDEYRAEELQALKNQSGKLRYNLKKRKSAAGFQLQEEVTTEMKRLEQQDKQRRHFSEMREAELSLKREERVKVRETGKTPYFHGRGAIREQMAKTRKGDKKGGARDSNAERREKKLAGKEKKRIPNRRYKEDE